MADILFCPLCGSSLIRYIGKKGDREVYYCEDCGFYFTAESLVPPFDVTITGGGERE